MSLYPSRLSGGGCLGMCIHFFLPSDGLYGNLLIERMNHCYRLNRPDFLVYNKAFVVVNAILI